ncbi:MAG: bifunctional GNAT family N-acetyltransferase/hotdog fold thioesterase [Colwellia sp.]|nr:bifunctional GNAT family N-acetyltransferase/hotdog fold thioesterase [Colwellia sp.]
MNKSITLQAPQSAQELQDYYQFRWKMLRQPWHQPLGSEQDSLEQQACHRMIVINEQVVAVGRLHKSNQTNGQIRYMAVNENIQGQGLGKKIVKALEQEASKQGVTEITLKARESAVSFYEKLGYEVQGFSHLLYDEIRHITMTKTLTALKEHQTELAQELQNTWHNTIPMSKVMNLAISYYDQKSIVTHCDIAFNQNIHHTMFAGSIYTLATLTGWGWVYLQLNREKLTGDIVLADASIRYIKPIKGAAYATTSFTQASGKLSVLNKGKKARFTLSVNVMSGDKLAAVFKGIYVVIPVKTANK